MDNVYSARQAVHPARRKKLVAAQLHSRRKRSRVERASRHACLRRRADASLIAPQLVTACAPLVAAQRFPL
jgi:hypothetical protein